MKRPANEFLQLVLLALAATSPDAIHVEAAISAVATSSSSGSGTTHVQTSTSTHHVSSTSSRLVLVRRQLEPVTFASCSPPTCPPTDQEVSYLFSAAVKAIGLRHPLLNARSLRTFFQYDTTVGPLAAQISAATGRQAALDLEAAHLATALPQRRVSPLSHRAATVVSSNVRRATPSCVNLGSHRLLSDLWDSYVYRQPHDQRLSLSDFSTRLAMFLMSSDTVPDNPTTLQFCRFMDKLNGRMAENTCLKLDAPEDHGTSILPLKHILKAQLITRDGDQTSSIDIPMSNVSALLHSGAIVHPSSLLLPDILGFEIDRFPKFPSSLSFFSENSFNFPNFHNIRTQIPGINLPSTSTSIPGNSINPTRIPSIPTKTPSIPTKTPIIPTKTPSIPTKTPIIPSIPSRIPTRVPINPSKIPSLPTTISSIFPNPSTIRPPKLPAANLVKIQKSGEHGKQTFFKEQGHNLVSGFAQGNAKVSGSASSSNRKLSFLRSWI